MIEWADRLTDCFYWSQSSPDSRQADLSLVDDVGGCFEAVAEALALVRLMLEEHPGNPRGPRTFAAACRRSAVDTQGRASSVWVRTTIRISWRSSSG